MKAERHIAIAGLAGGVAPTNIQGKEVWTMNDWYRVYPWLKHPQRVYQIHGLMDNVFLPGRYENWRERYNDSGAKIITVTDQKVKNQKRWDRYRRIEKKYGRNTFTSTMCYMMADAITERVDEIHIFGVKLISYEFVKQVPELLLWIERAEVEGIKVVCNMRETWEAKVKRVDWAKHQDIKEYWFKDMVEPKFKISRDQLL